jgi:hypothetical protein
VLECLASLQPEDCSLTTIDCLPEVAALEDCAPLSYCRSSSVYTFPDGCSSSGLCGGDILTQECLDDAATGVRTCTCYFGDQTLRTCVDEDTECSFDANSNDLHGCCWEVLL